MNSKILRTSLRLIKENSKLIKEKEEDWFVLTVKDKEKLDKIMTKCGYTKPRKFVWDALDNHKELFNELNKDKRLALVRLNAYGTSYEIEKIIQPYGFNYEEMNEPIN